MSIWTSKGRIHVGIQVNGKRVHRCLPEGATKSDAKQLEAELRRISGKRQAHVPHNPHMSVVMSLYLAHTEKLRSPDTAKYHALRAGQWLDCLSSDVDLAVQKMIADMHGHYAAGTINKSIGTIKKALTLAYEQRLIPEDYGARLKRLPENNQRTTWLSVAQVNKLANCASEQVRAAIWIALLTGCRRGEILKIQKADILQDSIHIRAGNTKTLKTRTVPIVPALRPWLEYLPIKITAEGLKTGFQRARIKAEMPEVNFHDLRHSTATLLINMGSSLHVVRDILGHTSVKTTERYSHLQIKAQETALNQLSAEILSRK